MAGYERFSRLMTEEKVYRDSGMDFRRICRRAGVRPRALGRLLRRDLGFSGAALLRAFRSRTDPPEGF